MPLFYVDIYQNHMSIEDLEGIEFRDVQAATAHCVASLIELAKGLVTAHTLERITLTVRDERRDVILKRTLTLTCDIS